MERAVVRAFDNLLLSCARLPQRQVRSDSDIAVQLTVERGDTVEHRLGQFNRRHLLFLDQPGNVGERFGAEFCGCSHARALLVSPLSTFCKGKAIMPLDTPVRSAIGNL